MKMKYKSKKPKIILFPYPAQGHVTPMLMLASSFHSRGFIPIFITPNYIHRQISSLNLQTNEQIRFIPIPDGLDDDDNDVPRDFFAVETAMETTMPPHLNRIIRDLQSEDESGVVVCMVVDLLASSAIEVGRECGVAVAGFWPAMFATYQLISAIPDMVRNGFISDTGIPQVGSIQNLPNQPLLCAEELPWLIGTPSAKKARFKFWLRTFARANSLQFLLINSFPEEDHHHHHHHHQQPKTSNSHVFFFIGPLNHHSNNLTKSPTFWEEDDTCLQWLDKQNPNSVIYISFGSWVTPINEGKIQSLAMALLGLKIRFIWVLKTNWRDGLPVRFSERVSGYGKIVSWAPQREILKHRAVGCYLTHCGWNSITEAIECRKRMLCFPVAGDQFLNCEYVVNVWRIGMKINGFGRKEVEDGVRKVMEDREINGRMLMLREKMMGKEADSRINSNFTSFVKNCQHASHHFPK